VARVDLPPQQVGGEVGVAAFGMPRALIVHPAVMATREAGDRVDGGALQRRHEHLGLECGADAVQCFAGVKIKVNLSLA
jgi:hypothetical protein